MRVTVKGYIVEGTPAEVEDLLGRLVKPTLAKPKLTEEQAKTIALKKKLAVDPNYNPYGGVVTSKEQLAMIEREEERQYAAELDTGVEYES